MIIPIGIQCLNAVYKKRIKKDTETLPFDWMLSNPRFVYEIIKLLLENKITTVEIVNNHFFCCDKKANYKMAEAYYTDNNGFALYNSKYDVIFPHDKNDIETRTKYIRRLDRLKDIILNSKDKLTFLYSSQSSLKSGNFTIDKRPVVINVYHYLTKIYSLINRYNDNNQMIVFDTILNEDRNILNKNIILYEIERCGKWGELLNKILEKNIDI